MATRQILAVTTTVVSAAAALCGAATASLPLLGFAASVGAAAVAANLISAFGDGTAPQTMPVRPSEPAAQPLNTGVTNNSDALVS